MLWLKDGKLVVDGDGKPIDCEECPCVEIDCYCCAEGTAPARIKITLEGVVNGIEEC